VLGEQLGGGAQLGGGLTGDGAHCNSCPAGPDSESKHKAQQ
jgi:hypothetical protein